MNIFMRPKTMWQHVLRFSFYLLMVSVSFVPRGVWRQGIIAIAATTVFVVGALMFTRRCRVV